MAFLPDYIQIGLYVILAIFLTGITIYTLQRRKDPKARIFSIGLIFQVIWVFSHLLLILAPTWQIKLVFDQFITFASYFTGTAYFLFSLEYNGVLNYKKHKKIYLSILIYSISVLIPVLIFPQALWMRTNIRADPAPSIIRYGNGIYLNILIGESYLKFIGALILFVRNLFLKERSRMVKNQSIVIISSYFLLFFSTIVSIWSGDLGIVEQFISFYLLGLINASILIFIAVFPLRTFEILPAAQNLILENIGEGYCVFNNKNELIEINEELMKILGVVNKTTITGKSPRQIFTQYTDLLVMALTQDNAINEVRMPTKEQFGYYQVSKWGIFRRNRNLGYVLIFHDISDRKEYERSLEKSKDELEQKFHHAQKMDSIGKLAGGISHEFNNFLTIILGNAELLKETLERSSENSIYLKELSDAAQNASQMTKRLLTFSRKNIIHPSIVEINSLLERMENPTQRLLGKDSDIQVKLKLNPNVGNIFIDEGLMEQILINLIVNARDAMPTGGTLELSTKPFVIIPEIKHKYPEADQSEYTCIIVTDTGIGMSNEVKKHLFEPFYTTKPKGTGTGLGLSMVYGAVKQFQGFIDVISNPGFGTSFLIYIPVVLNSVSEEKIRASEKLPQGNNELIILVEDDDQVRKITHKFLTKLGYQVLSFEGGNEAIEALKEGDKDIALLFTDVVMPGLKGHEVYEELRKFYPNLNVLYASGYTDKVIAQYGVLFKDTNFIAKPFTIESIAEKINEITKG